MNEDEGEHMDCPRCGLTNPDTGQRCDCGYDFLSKTLEQAQTSSDPKGVGGWLTFFILSATIFSPLLTLVNLSREIDTSGFTAAIAIDCAISIGISCFGVYVGVCLSKTRPNAVQSAKRYLIVVSVYSVLATVIGILASFAQPDDSTYKLIFGSLRSLVFSAIWYLYFTKSKRIRATFGVPQRVPAAPDTTTAQQTHITAVVDNQISVAGFAESEKTLGLVSVVSAPSGADICVDGTFFGSTPAEFKVKSGERSFTITKDGYNSFQRNIQIVPNGKQTLSADLTLDDAHTLASQSHGD